MDRLVQSLDVRRLKARLLEHPEEVHAVNERGDQLTHMAAYRNAVMVAELLFARGADPMANSARGLWPAHVAAATNHPNAALYMLERAAKEGRRERPRMALSDLALKIDALLDQKNPGLKDASALASELTGIPDRILDDPRELVKQLAQLEALSGSVGGVDSEGWWQHRFLPQRVRTLVAFMIDNKLSAGDRQSIIEEIATTLDAHRTAERIFAVRKLNVREVTSLSMRLEAEQTAYRVMQQPVGAETVLPVGWDGHAVYMGLRKTTIDTAEGPQEVMRIRVDNVGDGVSKAHENGREGVSTITFHVPTELLMTKRGGAAFDEFLRGVLLAKAVNGSKEDDFYVQIARFKGFLSDRVAASTLAESQGQITVPAQTAGNCTVENAQVGTRARLGDKLFNRLKRFEVKFANALISDTSVDFLVEFERQDRDFGRLQRLLRTRGPWAKQLADLFSSVKGRTYLRVLASPLSYDELVRVVKSKDDRALELLLSHGAREMHGPEGRTLLHVAALIGRPQMCAALISHGASVTSLDEDGNSPLHFAAKHGSSAVIQVLLERGGQLDQPNNAGVTPRELLREKVDEVSQLAHLLKKTAPPRSQRRLL